MKSSHRQRVARLLLVVFLPALVAASLHTHSVAGAEDTCMECVAHTPHAGHLSVDTSHFGDCLLCQFCSLSYLVGFAAAVVVPVVLRRAAVCEVHRSWKNSPALGLASRGPPVYA